jgi:chromosome segregation ATPase
MGGRCATDLLRGRMGKKQYRDQRKKLGLLEERIATAEDEKQELKDQLKSLDERLKQIVDAIQSPDLKKLVRENEKLASQLLKAQEELGQREAEAAAGKDCIATALMFRGKVQELAGDMGKVLEPDSLDTWLAVHDMLVDAAQVMHDVRARMADELLKRMEAGKLEKFDPEDPRTGRDMAAVALRPGRGRG